MDNMTSSEVGVKPTLRFAEVEQPMPSDAGLSPEEQVDFKDAKIQTMNVKLCDVRNSVLTIATRFQKDDFANFSHVIQHPMDRLAEWRSSVPAEYSFDFSSGIPGQMQRLPSMRSLASVYLRYHQGHILLIRPIYIQLLAVALGGDGTGPSLNGLADLGNSCLEAARCNMRMLMDLSRLDRLAQYGFWESLHLFSAISVFPLARLAHGLQSFSLHQTDDDLALYNAAKELLHSMAADGNAASKGHVRLTNEIDRLLDAVSAHTSSLETQLVMPMADLEQDIFQWIESIGNIDEYQN